MDLGKAMNTLAMPRMARLADRKDCAMADLRQGAVALKGARDIVSEFILEHD